MRKKREKNGRKTWDISCTVEDDMSENFFQDKNFPNWTTFFSRVQKILKLRPKCKFDGKLRPKMAANFNFSVKFEKKLPETIQKGKVLKIRIFIGSGKFCSFYSVRVTSLHTFIKENKYLGNDIGFNRNKPIV